MLLRFMASAAALAILGRLDVRDTPYTGDLRDTRDALHASPTQGARGSGVSPAMNTPTGAPDPAQGLAPVAGDSLRTLIDRALVTSRPADFDRALAFVEAGLSQKPNDAVLLHYRGFVLYRKASYLATSGRDAKLARTMFEDAEQTLARSAAALRWPETAALQSAVVGQLISLGGAMAGLRMGAKSLRLLDEAVAAGPENPRVWMLKGVSDLFRPKLFGGSPEKAEVSLKRALALFDKDAPASPAPWWGHAEAYGWLGQVYVKQGRLEEAKLAYAKALDLQPGNAWVLELLLPAVRGDAR